MFFFKSTFTLRAKLIAAGALVQLLALTVLLLGSAHLLQRTLQQQARAETEQVVALLDQALAAPLAQRDYATLQQMVDLMRSDSSVRYLVVLDHRDKVVVTTGWPSDAPLPARDQGHIDLDRADATLHLRASITMGPQPLGRLEFGLSTAGLRESRREFVRASLGVGLAALLLSMLALAATATAVTRRLERLSVASRRLAAGDWSAQVEGAGTDEVGQLAGAFNAMASALRERMHALQDSEAAQRQSAAQANEERGRLTTLLGAMPAGIVFVDAAGQVIYANAAFCRVWSLAAVEPGQALVELLPVLAEQLVPEDQPALQALLDPQAKENKGPLVAGGSSSPGVAGRELLLRNGRTLAQRVQPVEQGGQRVGSIWFHEDITEARQTQERARLALFDPLTSLLNRRGLLDALHAALATASQPLAGPVGQAATVDADDTPGVTLLFIDLDDFKRANDLAGHRAGDDILVSVASTLARLMRRGEVVARMGGDEFAVLCPRANLREASAIAQRMVHAVSELRFPSSAGELRVGCSVGIARHPLHGHRAEDLMAAADAAMYQTKQRGKNGWAVFEGVVTTAPRAADTSPAALWASRLKRALQQDAFVLHHQPVARASDLHVCHQEALLRWVDEDDKGRLISPSEFLLHAERSGQLRAIDRWVFERVVQELAQTPAEVSLAANLSIASLSDTGFASYLESALRHHDVDPRRLIIEVADAGTWREPLQVRERFDSLRALGCPVHLDHYGVGLAAHGQLKLLNVDAVKLDGSCVRLIQHDEYERIFVGALVRMAHALHKTVIATHVEDEATLSLLREMGVDQVQGFHVARPAAPVLEARSRSQARLHVVAGMQRSFSRTL